MGYPNKENISKLWIRMKSYINARIEAFDTIVEDVVANAGYMEMELLWENASPSSDFAAQTINVDLSGYSHCLIIALLSKGDLRALTPVLVAIGESGHIDHAGDVNYIRNNSVYDNKVVFGDCNYYGTYNNTSQTIYNSHIIPYRIYGIKGVA